MSNQAKVVTIREARYARDMDAFINTGMFDSPEIKARRAARRRWDAMRAAKATQPMTQAEWEKKEREMQEANQREASDAAASVAGALSMAAGLLGLAMML